MSIDTGRLNQHVSFDHDWKLKMFDFAVLVISSIQISYDLTSNNQIYNSLVYSHNVDGYNNSYIIMKQTRVYNT